MSKKVYVVTAYRFGDREKHSYLVGVYDTEDTALLSAIDEEDYRGGKYYCEVLKCKVSKEIIPRDKVIFKVLKPLPVGDFNAN